MFGGGAGMLCPAEVAVVDNRLLVNQGAGYRLSVTSSGVTIHEPFVDLVLRRADGGPVPLELIPPLWIAYRTENRTSSPYGRVAPRPIPTDPRGWQVDVSGLGAVQILELPAGVGTESL
jgi:hypothetical protein